MSSREDECEDEDEEHSRTVEREFREFGLKMFV